MFLFSARKYLEELGKFRPDILNACIDAFSVVEKMLCKILSESMLRDLQFVQMNPLIMQLWRKQTRLW